MIWVTRLNGSEIVVNADLIEVIEATPDTILTLVDGKRYVVQEEVEDVVDRVRAFRASILQLLEPSNTGHRANLYLLPGDPASEPNGGAHRHLESRPGGHRSGDAHQSNTGDPRFGERNEEG